MDSFYQELIEEHIMNPNRPRSMQGDIVELLQEHRKIKMCTQVISHTNKVHKKLTIVIFLKFKISISIN